MAPWMWFIGFAALIPLAFVFANPIILIGGLETYKRLTFAAQARHSSGPITA